MSKTEQAILDQIELKGHFRVYEWQVGKRRSGRRERNAARKLLEAGLVARRGEIVSHRGSTRNGTIWSSFEMVLVAPVAK